MKKFKCYNCDGFCELIVNCDNWEYDDDENPITDICPASKRMEAEWKEIDNKES